ncbi:MAG: universal stress protein [Chloroflexi bacterium]|nr:universal stress protein [Chloroflexota bacterium]
MPWKKVLVPLHGDDTDANATRMACNLARESKGKVYLVYVIEVPHHLPLDSNVSTESSKGEEILRRMENLVKECKAAVETALLQARDSGPAIVQEAVERQADVILIGVPYQTQYGSFTLGRTAPYVLQYAPCPVMVWRMEQPALAKAGGEQTAGKEA